MTFATLIPRTNPAGAAIAAAVTAQASALANYTAANAAAHAAAIDGDSASPTDLEKAVVR